MGIQPLQTKPESVLKKKSKTNLIKTAGSHVYTEEMIASNNKNYIISTVSTPSKNIISTNTVPQNVVSTNSTPVLSSLIFIPIKQAQKKLKCLSGIGKTRYFFVL